MQVAPCCTLIPLPARLAARRRAHLHQVAPQRRLQVLELEHPALGGRGGGGAARRVARAKGGQVGRRARPVGRRRRLAVAVHDSRLLAACAGALAWARPAAFMRGGLGCRLATRPAAASWCRHCRRPSAAGGGQRHGQRALRQGTGHDASGWVQRARLPHQAPSGRHGHIQSALRHLRAAQAGLQQASAHQRRQRHHRRPLLHRCCHGGGGRRLLPGLLRPAHRLHPALQLRQVGLGQGGGRGRGSFLLVSDAHSVEASCRVLGVCATARACAAVHTLP